MTLGRYRKFIVALVGALGIIATEIPPDAPDWLPQAIGIATAAGVYLLRNDQPTPVSLTRVARPEERPPPPRETRLP